MSVMEIIRWAVVIPDAWDMSGKSPRIYPCRLVSFPDGVGEMQTLDSVYILSRPRPKRIVERVSKV
jgi:hypothetical protein